MPTVSLSGPRLASDELTALAAFDIEIRPVDVERDGWSALAGCWAHVLGGPEVIGETDVVSIPESIKLVCFVGTGYSSYVDVASLNARGVTVCYTPYANAWSTAEFAIALLLAGRRRILEGAQQIKDGQWAPVEGRSLAGALVGVVGFGHVGQLVVRTLVRGFGSKVLVWNRTDRSDEIAAAGAQAVSLEELFQRSEAVSLHVDATRDPLVGRDLLRSTPEGFMLVNTSRAAVVDHSALLEVMLERADVTALSDVYPAEPVSPATDPVGLLGLGPSRFTLTPHMAYISDHASTRMADMVAANLLAALQGADVPFLAR